MMARVRYIFIRTFAGMGERVPSPHVPIYSAGPASWWAFSHFMWIIDVNSPGKTYKAKGYPAKHLNAAVMRLAGVLAWLSEPG